MITPLFDPRGNSWIHNTYPIIKIVWLLSIAVSAFMLNNLLTLILLFVECLTIYYFIFTSKETPTPPILSLVSFAILLLFVFNYFLWDSNLGQWKGNNVYYKNILLSHRMDYSLVRALALGSTMLSFFDFTLSTYPRNIARALERIKFSRLICEPIAIALRFLPTFEVNIKMLFRIFLIKYKSSDGKTRLTEGIKNFVILLQSILIMALSQANLTGKSLTLRGFNTRGRKHIYVFLKPELGNYIFIILIILNILSIIFIRYKY